MASRAKLRIVSGLNAGDSVSVERGSCRLIGRHLSEAETALIDRDGCRILDGAAAGILTDHRVALDEIARQLLEKETLDGEAVYALIEELTGEAVMPESFLHQEESDAASSEVAATDTADQVLEETVAPSEG